MVLKDGDALVVELKRAVRSEKNPLNSKLNANRMQTLHLPRCLPSFIFQVLDTTSYAVWSKHRSVCLPRQHIFSEMLNGVQLVRFCLCMPKTKYIHERSLCTSVLRGAAMAHCSGAGLHMKLNGCQSDPFNRQSR